MFISVTSLCTHQRVLLGGPWRWLVAAGLQTSSSRKSRLESTGSGTSDARPRRRITDTGSRSTAVRRSDASLDRHDPRPETGTGAWLVPREAQRELELGHGTGCQAGPPPASATCRSPVPSAFITVRPPGKVSLRNPTNARLVPSGGQVRLGAAPREYKTHDQSTAR